MPCMGLSNAAVQAGNGNLAPRTGSNYIDEEDYLLFGLRSPHAHAVPSVLQAGM